MAGRNRMPLMADDKSLFLRDEVSSSILSFSCFHQPSRVGEMSQVELNTEPLSVRARGISGAWVGRVGDFAVPFDLSRVERPPGTTLHYRFTDHVLYSGAPRSPYDAMRISLILFDPAGNEFCKQIVSNTSSHASELKLVAWLQE